MSREWKPGDVAMVPGIGRALMLNSGEWVTQRVGRRHDAESFAHFADVRPLVVIDPEDREQMRGIAECAADGDAAEWRVDMWQRHFRGLANPKPAKPDEPQGLGAVVEDAEGRIYTRYETSRGEPQPWWQSAYGPERDVVRRFCWADIDAVRVLGKGVTQ